MTSLLKVAMDAADANAVKDSLRDETAAVAKYRKYSDAAKDVSIKKRLAEIGRDEEHHQTELRELIEKKSSEVQEMSGLLKVAEEAFEKVALSPGLVGRTVANKFETLATKPLLRGVNNAVASGKKINPGSLASKHIGGTMDFLEKRYPRATKGILGSVEGMTAEGGYMDTLDRKGYTAIVDKFKSRLADGAL